MQVSCYRPGGVQGQLSYQVWQSSNHIYLSFILFAEPLTDEGGEETGVLGENLGEVFAFVTVQSLYRWSHSIFRCGGECRSQVAWSLCFLELSSADPAYQWEGWPTQLVCQWLDPCMAAGRGVGQGFDLIWFLYWEDDGLRPWPSLPTGPRYKHAHMIVTT